MSIEEVSSEDHLSCFSRADSTTGHVTGSNEDTITKPPVVEEQDDDDEAEADLDDDDLNLQNDYTVSQEIIDNDIHLLCSSTNRRSPSIPPQYIVQLPPDEDQVLLLLLLLIIIINLPVIFDK